MTSNDKYLVVMMGVQARRGSSKRGKRFLQIRFYPRYLLIPKKVESAAQILQMCTIPSYISTQKHSVHQFHLPFLPTTSLRTNRWIWGCRYTQTFISSPQSFCVKLCPHHKSHFNKSRQQPWEPTDTQNRPHWSTTARLMRRICGS